MSNATLGRESELLGSSRVGRGGGTSILSVRMGYTRVDDSESSVSVTHTDAVRWICSD